MVVPCICFGLTYRALKDGNVRLSRNIGKRLQFYATSNRRRAPISFALRQNPEIMNNVSVYASQERCVLYRVYTKEYCTWQVRLF